MLGTHVNDLADLVEIGERIDTDIREGKLSLAGPSARKGPFPKKNEGEVSYVYAPKGPKKSYSYQAKGRGQSLVVTNQAYNEMAPRPPKTTKQRPARPRDEDHGPIFIVRMRTYMKI